MKPLYFKETSQRFVSLLLFLMPGLIFMILLNQFVVLPILTIFLLVGLISLLLASLEIFAPYLDLFVLGFYLAAFNLVYFFDIVLDLPRDTTAYYQFFYVFYNHLYQAGEIPLWFPDLVFGVRSGFIQLGFIAPTSYLSMLLGKLFDIENVYLLFVSSAFLQQSIYLLGAYLLGGALKFSRPTRFLFSFVSIASLLWYQHYFFELQLVYLFPLQIYLVYQACITLKGYYLLLLAISFAIWLIGGLYLPILGFYVCGLFGLVLLLSTKTWPRFHFEKKDFFLLLIFLCLFGVCAAIFLSTSQAAVFPGRSMETLADGKPLLSRSYKESLNHLVINFLDPFDGKIFTRDTFEQNLHTYLGLLPLFFLGYAWLNREKHPVFLAAGITSLFILWLSFNELFAQSMLKLLPLLTYYRWLGLSYPYLRILLALAAMFGFESAAQQKLGWQKIAFILLAMAFLLDGALVMVNAEQRSDFSLGNLRGFIFRLFIYALAVLGWLLIRFLKPNGLGKIQPAQVFQIIFGCALMIDLLSYQLVWATLLPREKSVWSVETQKAMTVVSQLEYLPQRTASPELPRGIAIQQAGFFSGFRYPIAYQFGQFDPCFSFGYVQVIEKDSQALRALIKALTPPREVFGNYSESVKALIGCQVSKLRLLPRAVSLAQAPTPEKLTDAELTSTTLLTNPLSQIAQSGIRQGQIEKIELGTYNYNQFLLKIENPYSPGAWLSYSDSYHPAWQASLDGEKVEIIQANLGFKAVWVPFGSHALKFAFVDPWLLGLQEGLFILGSLGSLALVTWLLVIVYNQTGER